MKYKSHMYLTFFIRISYFALDYLLPSSNDIYRRKPRKGMQNGSEKTSKRTSRKISKKTLYENLEYNVPFMI